MYSLHCLKVFYCILCLSNAENLLGGSSLNNYLKIFQSYYIKEYMGQAVDFQQNANKSFDLELFMFVSILSPLL